MSSEQVSVISVWGFARDEVKPEPEPLAGEGREFICVRRAGRGEGGRRRQTRREHEQGRARWQNSLASEHEKI